MFVLYFFRCCCRYSCGIYIFFYQSIQSYFLYLPIHSYLLYLAFFISSLYILLFQPFSRILFSLLLLFFFFVTLPTPFLISLLPLSSTLHPSPVVLPPFPFHDYSSPPLSFPPFSLALSPSPTPSLSLHVYLSHLPLPLFISTSPLSLPSSLPLLLPHPYPPASLSTFLSSSLFPLSSFLLASPPIPSPLLFPYHLPSLPLTSPHKKYPSSLFLSLPLNFLLNPYSSFSLLISHFTLPPPYLSPYPLNLLHILVTFPSPSHPGGSQPQPPPLSSPSLSPSILVPPPVPSL